MRRVLFILAGVSLSCNVAAEWVVVSENAEYIAYADPATLIRDGDRAQMSDLIDLKSPRSSPYGMPHASSIALSEFDCSNARLRTIAFALHAEPMGNGDPVETAAVSDRWLTIAPGTLLRMLWQFACG